MVSEASGRWAARVGEAVLAPQAGHESDGVTVELLPRAVKAFPLASVGEARGALCLAERHERCRVTEEEVPEDGHRVRQVYVPVGIHVAVLRRALLSPAALAA